MEGSVPHCVDSGYCIGGEEVGWVSDLYLTLFYLSLQWFPLQGGQGQVHLRLEWLSLLPDAEKLEQVTNVQNSKLAGEK